MASPLTMAFVMDPIEAIDIEKDTTFLLMWEAQERGHALLYVDPAEGRRWLDYIRDDPRVRARFGKKIYPLQAVLVGKPGELEGFDSDRFIYRLDPRTE